MIVNFRCQPDWATGCPNIRSNVTLGVTVRVFIGEMTFELVDWVEILSLMRMSLIQSIKGLNTTTVECLSWDIVFSCPWPRTYPFGSPGSQAFGLRLELHNPLACVPSLLTVHLGILSLHNHMSQFLIINLIICIPSLSIENPDLYRWI